VVALAAAVTIATGVVAITVLRDRVTAPPAALDTAAAESRAAVTRQALFAEIQPVKLANCDLERFGEPNDGGYLLCANLLADVEAGYSYGINGFDGWGCDVSRKLRVRVHQYDCFNTEAPVCPGGDTVFHPECVDDSAHVEDGRPFDTIASQMIANGDGARRTVVKIDVEGAEWDAFLQTPEDVLQRIDQLAVEFHKTDEEKFVSVVRKLKNHFHVAHLHFNNWSCTPDIEPFPAWAYEVLFVNKRLGAVDPAGRWDGPVSVDALNNPNVADCQ
jgi:hypothetical protein